MDDMEMNMHVPQSEQSRIELRELASVPSQIISPSTHKPIISIVQDTLVGSYLFTRYDNYVNRNEIFDIMIDVPTFDGTLPEPEIKAGTKDKDLPKDFPRYKYSTIRDLWSGRQILSMVIPKVSFINKGKGVEIVNGIVKSGVFDNSVLGSLVHIIFNKFGQDRTQQFLDDIQNIVTNWVLKSGFSVGIGDLVPDKSSSNKMNEIIDKSKKKVIEIINHVHQNILENKHGKTTSDEFEMAVKIELNSVTENTGKTAQACLKSDNRMMSMINSGSKGSNTNISQMMACVGQQSVDGKRIQYGFTDRTLPHFHKYDDGASARGFVENSFMKGLTPTEFFFHAMGGREGLIDTAVKSVTGDTPIIIIEDNIPKYINIGDWIDTELNKNKDEIKHFDERQMELLYLKNKVYIPTTDYNGNLSWGEVSAMTRHDPGTELYEIITHGGKKVIVTESKSLLIWNKELNEFREIPTPEIKVGDYVPVNCKLPTPPIIKKILPIDLNNDLQDNNFISNNEDIYNELQRVFSNNHKLEFKDERFAHGISMLLSRINIYSKVDNNKIYIYKNHIDKNLFNFDNVPSFDDNITELNDVVLDKIKTINILGIDKYPKVYDLTIPSTLNFGLANGLQVRDTSETGYIQRKLVKCMEDAYIATDYTVRNANGTIIQFLYGEDGFDGTKIEKQSLSIVKMSNKSIYEKFRLTIDDDIYNLYNPEIADDLFKNREVVDEQLLSQVNKILADRDYYFDIFFKDKPYENEIYVPINIERIVNDAILNFPLHTNLSDLHPSYVLNKLVELSDTIKITNEHKGNESILVFANINLNPKVLLNKKTSKLAFDYVIANINQMFYGSIVNPGELVGTISAQSMGEPTTQMTLNTFHLAGVGSKSKVNQGVPRIVELLHVSKNIKAPSDTVVLKEPYCYNKEYSQKILNELTITTIKQLTINSEIYFDSESINCETSEIQQDKLILDIYKKFNQLDSIPTDTQISPWVLRFKLDKMKLLEKNIRMSDIYFAIISRFNTDNQDITCVYSDDNSGDLILRIQCITNKTEESECDQEDMICILKTLEKTILNDIILSGIKGIDSASMESKENYLVFNNENQDYDKKTKWYINTDGTNLEDILIHPAINPYCTYSNNVIEVLEVLGLEAARYVLFNEIYSTFENSGSYVNSRHINLLVDIMTNRGHLMSVDRHGINKGDRGPLAKCSFEETPDIIARAAIFGELDKLKSVSSNIMLGQEVPIGTGSVDLLFDEEKYFNTLIPIQEDAEAEVEQSISDKDAFTSRYCENLF